jgi:hypothetical protein
MATVRHLGLFPFCPRPVAAAAVDGIAIGAGNTQFPLGVPKNTAALWYWRVKTWRLDATVTIAPGFDSNYPDGTTVTHAESFPNNANYTFGEATDQPANEKNLVCARGTTAEMSGSGSPAMSSAQFYLFSQLNFNDRAFFDGAGLIYPSLYILSGFESGQITTRQFDSTHQPGGTITIAGTSVPSFITDGVAAASVIVSVEEFWPYDPGDGGGPIYDSATGAQLRAFPS